MIKTTASAFLFMAAGLSSSRAAEPLQFEKAISLTGVEGRIDHMSADVTGGRLFVAALGNTSFPVLDWKSGNTINALPHPGPSLHTGDYRFRQNRREDTHCWGFG